MAGPIITCPACTKKFKGKEGIVGKKIKCPLCSTPFVVSAELAQAKVSGAAKASPDGAGQSKPMQRVSWTKEDDNSNPYGLGEFDERPRCPNCANLLEHEKAVICLFCGYNNQTRSWGETVRTFAVTPGQHFVHLLPGLFFTLMLILFAIGILALSLAVPRVVAGTWASWIDHESTRFWTIFVALGFMWAFANLAFRRLVLNPKPKEIVKEDIKR